MTARQLNSGQLNSGNGGFTLMEMVMAISIIGVLAAVGGQIIGGGIDAYDATDESLENMSKVRYTVNRLAREITEVDYTGTAYDINMMNSNRFNFNKTDGETVDIDGSSLPDLQLQYASLGVTATLSDDITAFTINYYQQDGVTVAPNASSVEFVEIQFTLGSGSAATSRRFRVALRKPV
jgi:prepilin-type N-terminal cleavage/methylation domain-containing protein